MPDVEQSPQWATDMQGNRRKEEKVIYYRNKRGWITWGDTQPSKQLHMLQKGCTPLSQYGYITDSADLWGPILRHPNGPSEFPVEQVLAFRWYKNPPVKGVKFPQLAGQKIIEFPCPECARPGFHQATHLGSHLRVMHGYDRSEVLKYGEAMGIDFSKVPGGREVLAYDFTEADVAVQEVERDAEELFEIATVTPQTPASDELAAEIEALRCEDCGWEPKADSKKPEFALSLHYKAKHPEAVPA